MSRGLYGQKYSGYFANDLNFFNTATYIGSESTFTSISLGDEGTSYSWKWYGFIIASSTGTYTFQTTSDDASYVYIDGTQVVNNGDTHGARTRTGTIDLILGKRYSIQIYFGEGGGAASMIFEWSGGSQTTVTTDLTTDVLQFYPQSDIARRGKNLFQPRDVAFYRIPSEYQNVNKMISNTTNIPGFGSVIASSSSIYNSSWRPWKAFDGVVADPGWVSQNNTYSKIDGSYLGSRSIGGYTGEWMKIQFPIPLFLYSSTIHTRPNRVAALVKTGYIIASNDNINWVELFYINTNDGVESIFLDTPYLITPYCFYAIVATSIQNASPYAYVNIAEWFLYTRKIEYNPININDGLQVHLDATVGVSYPGSGDTWYDISGNGRHGTWASDPSFNSTDGYFDTTSGVCTGPASNSFGITNTSGYTIFIMWYQNTLTQESAFKFMKDGSGSASRGIFAHCTWNNQNIYFDQGGCCNADTRLNVLCPNSTGTWHTTAFVRETGSSTRRIYIDGSLSATNTAAAANIDLNSSAVYYVGDDQYGSDWNARIRCFLAYNRGLSATEIAQLHAKFI